MLHELYNTPWLITRAGMDMVLAIASREGVTEAVLKAYEAGKDREFEPKAIESAVGEPLREFGRARVREGVAVIPVRGPIVRHADLFSSISGATSLSSLALDMSAALSSDSVNSILLNVDSPGGEANGVAEFSRMVRAADAKKPVTAYAGGMAASAAYWIASAAGEFVLGETAQAGSIGVVAEWMSQRDMEEKLGIKRGTVTSDGSPKKRLDPSSEEGQAEIKALVNELMGHFTGAVARYRGVTREEVLRDFGQGGLLVGQKAVKVGMADRVGTFERTLRDLKRGRPRPARKMEADLSAGGNAMAGWKQRLTRLVSGSTDHEAREIIEKLAEPDNRSAARVEGLAAEVHSLVTTPDPAVAKRLEALEAENTRLRVDGFKKDGDAFAAQQVSAGKASAAERDEIAAAYAAAAADDHAHPVKDGFKSRVQMIAAIYDARPKSLMTEEVVDARAPVGSRKVDPSDPGNPATSAREKERAEGIQDGAKFAAERNGKRVASAN